MSDPLLSDPLRAATHRIADLYRGPGGRFWERIERERPASYLEENLVLGRRQETALLRAWLEDVDVRGSSILDAGCGSGRFALELASWGARVLAVDLRPCFSAAAREAARRRELALAVADFRHVLPAGRRTGFDIVVLREVIQDYEPAEYRELFEPLATGGAERLILTLRQESLWTPMTRHAWPEGMAETVDITTLLRRIHLLTPFRLRRQKELKRRNFRSWVGELARFE